MNTVIETLIGRYLSDPTLAAILGSNIFTPPRFDSPQPDYPALTLQYFGGRAESLAPLADLQILISAFSETGFEECWKIINKVKTLTDRVGGSGDGYSWVTTVRNTPYQDSERTERQVYILHVIYSVQIVG